MGVSPGLEEKVDNIVSTLQSGQEEVNGVWESTTNNRKWDPYLKTYNEGWKTHPNFNWVNSQAGPSSGPPRGQFLQRPQGQQFNQQVPQQAAEQAPPSSSLSTEDMIRALTLSVSQLATAINRLEARDSNALPSQTVVNPKNVSAVSLRNGRQLVEAEKVKRKVKEPMIHEIEEDIVIKEGEEASIVKEKEHIPSSILVVEPEVPFPDALKRTHHFEHNKDIYEVFQKCEVNIPLLNLLKSIPKYEKFLKELCTIKRNNKLKGVKKVKKGSVEDVLVLVDNLFFPTDFFVLDMEHDKHAASIMLGRPFLKNASTKIDVSSGSMTMESSGQGAV
ncbi:uncharacterized protein LOC141639200 [Silene latifolia]|uniref:uncharacterized protein LOC141639200 n=1 Tax=Silene latifolia TaxID=37657 RepID=UPI003D7871ED